MLFYPVVVAVASLPLLSSFVLATDCVRTYNVVGGDICDSISAAQNVSTYQLAANNVQINSDCSNLTPGEALCLGTAGEDCQTTYVVQAEDTCDIIEGKFSINATMLWTNNPNIDSSCSNIYIGEVLCVANAVAVPPVPSGGLVGTAIPSTAVNPTAVPSSTSAAAASATLTQNNGDDGDDDDSELPWCDEL